jgi:hypothetical protein
MIFEGEELSGAGSGLAEEGVEVGEHGGGVPLLEADELAGDFSATVDDVGFGDYRGAVGEGDGGAVVLGGGVAIGGKNHVFIAQKFLVNVGVLVGGDAKHHAIAWLDIFVEVVETGRFFLAGRTPGGPEIQDDDFTAEVRKADWLAGEVQRKILSALAGNRRFALAITRESKGDEDRYAEGRRRPSHEFPGDYHAVLY